DRQRSGKAKFRKIATNGGAQDERDGRHCWPDERHVEGRKIRHLRIFTRHDIRMVRFLSLRGAGTVLRRAVLPRGERHGALLSAFATYAAGFLVRPFGAVIFGRIGDLVGRKYTFLVTIMVMGSATFLVGVLP